MTNYQEKACCYSYTQPQVKLQCTLCVYLGRLHKFSLCDLVLYLGLLWWWCSSWSSTQFIRFYWRKHSTFWKMRIKLPCRKGWIGPQLMWLHSRKYKACLAQSTAYHHGWVPYVWLLINIWSKHHVLLMRLPFSLGVFFSPELGNRLHSHLCTMHKEHTQSLCNRC